MTHRYNNIVAEPWQIDDFGDGSNMALCIASTRAIWNPFKQYIHDLVTRNESIPLNPLDTYNSMVIQAAVTNAIKAATSTRDKEEEKELLYKVYTDWNCDEPCHLQTMGSLTGVAHYFPPPVMWSAHPSFGIWFSFRAVIVFSTVKVRDLDLSAGGTTTTTPGEYVIPAVDIPEPPEVVPSTCSSFCVYICISM